MTEPKDDGGPFFPFQEIDPDGAPIGLGTPGASFRAVAAMHAMAANRIAFPNAPTDDLAMMAKWDTDALIAELKK